MNQSINIIQVEAKDLVEVDNYIVKSINKYKATLDYSLETLKLNSVHQKVFRNNKFVFRNGNKLYTDDVISVNFNYRSKDYSVDELRNKLYKDGFICNNNHYIRFKRSSGSSRIGKCLFIRKELFGYMMKWSYMGLRFSNDEEVDLASLESYISLTTSSIIDTIKISPKNILVIDDFESLFKDKTMVTKINSDNRLETNLEEVEICNSIWDGQSLMDSSMYTGKYENKSMLLLRNRFFKSACFNTNIQKFFKDNNITSIHQLNGFTLAKDINDIKLITTPSSIKFLKFGNIEEYFENLEDDFGIVKYEKPTHFFEGDLVQTHYQLLNTLELSYSETETFLEDTFKYIRLLKNDLPTLRYHLKMSCEEDLRINQLVSTNDFVYTMLKVNDKIKNTNMFLKFRTDLVNSFVKNIKKGHVLVKGNYSVLLGNGYEMLLQSIGKFDGSSLTGIDEVINYKFNEGEDLVAVRSPHVTMGNLWLVKNVRSDMYEKYFNLSNEIICVNAINNNIQERLNGSDYDSDMVMITNNKAILEAVKRNYDNFLVPTSKVVSKKVKRYNNYQDKYDLDKKTSVNKIGEIINLSQILNSYLWELKKKGEDWEDVYKDICKLAVMSGIEIDKAKKEFVVDNRLELKDLREKYSFLVKNKPMFFYHLPTDFDNIKNLEKYRNYETTMDYLEDIIIKRARKIRAKGIARLPISEIIVDNSEISIRDANIKQANRINQLCLENSTKCNKIWLSDSLNSSEKYKLSLETKEDLFLELKKMKINSSTIKYIILNLDSKLQRKMCTLLFSVAKDEFMKVIKEGSENTNVLTKKHDGEIEIYGIKFAKNE